MLACHELREHGLQHVRVDQLLLLKERARDCGGHVARGLKTLIRILGQRAHHDFFQLGRQIAHVGTGRLDHARAHGFE